VLRQSIAREPALRFIGERRHDENARREQRQGQTEECGDHGTRYRAVRGPPLDVSY
jgi:hypothetical protein